MWAGAGGGGGPEASGEALDYAVSKGVRVVISTRGGAGRVIRGRRHQERQLITADNLSPYHAVALLQLGLAKPNDRAELQRMFETY